MRVFKLQFLSLFKLPFSISGTFKSKIWASMSSYDPKTKNGSLNKFKGRAQIHP